MFLWLLSAGTMDKMSWNGRAVFKARGFCSCWCCCWNVEQPGIHSTRPVTPDKTTPNAPALLLFHAISRPSAGGVLEKRISVLGSKQGMVWSLRAAAVVLGLEQTESNKEGFMPWDPVEQAWPPREAGMCSQRLGWRKEAESCGGLEWPNNIY